MSCAHAGLHPIRRAGFLGDLLQAVLRSAGWLPVAWRVSVATNRFLLLSVPKAFLQDVWAVHYLLSGTYSEIKVKSTSHVLAVRSLFFCEPTSSMPKNC